MPETTEAAARPIIFSGPMVRAILAGQKTQTRRVIKPQPVRMNIEAVLSKRILDAYILPGKKVFWETDDTPNPALIEQFCPYGKRGDVLWVRESFRVDPAADAEGHYPYTYLADNARDLLDYSEVEMGRIKPGKTYPSIHMPRWASRVTLRIADVRVQRVQDISEEDARAEGVPPNWAGDLAGFVPDEHGFLPPTFDPEDYEVCTAREAFDTWWDLINGKREGCSWDANPWVWAVSFEVVKEAARADAA
jgi:hypothetical protein